MSKSEIRCKWSYLSLYPILCKSSSLRSAYLKSNSIINSIPLFSRNFIFRPLSILSLTLFLHPSASSNSRRPVDCFFLTLLSLPTNRLDDHTKARTYLLSNSTDHLVALPCDEIKIISLNWLKFGPLFL